MGSIVDIIEALAAAGPQRDSAETAFEQQWASNPAVLPALLQVVSDDAAQAHVRTLAAVLFRRALSKSIEVPNADAPVAMWRLLPSSEAETCQNRMLRLFAQPPVSATVSLRLKIADALAEMARLVVIAEDGNNAGWPQLSAMLAEPALDGRMVLRVLGDVPSLLAPFSGKQLQMLFERFLLHSPDVEVRVAALKAFELVVDDLISADDDAEDDNRKPDERLKPLGALITRLDAILAPILAHDDDSVKTDALNALTELAITCPKMFREIAAALISALLPLAADSQTSDEEVRTAALELALVILEELPNVVRKNKALVAHLVHVSFAMVGEVEDDPEWYEADPEFSDPADIDPIGVLGEQAIDRISVALGSKAVFEPLFLHLVAPALSNGAADWKGKYAALKSIASGAEGCSDALEERLGDLLSLVWPCFAVGNHPRVHFAACHALGQLCTDFSGQVQGPYCTQSLTSLLQVLQASRVNCVQQHAAAALVNFAEGVDAATIQQFLGDLINTLVRLLQQSNGRPGLQQQLIATIAAFSSVAGEHFAQHYDTVIRLLLPCVLSSEEGVDAPAQTRMLQIRAVEAISLFAHAIGRDKFKASESGPVFLRRLVQLTETKFEADDWKDFLPAAWVRIAQVMREEFLPFAPLVLTKLRVVAMQEADMAMVDADAYDPDEYPEQEWDFVERGGRRLGIRTSGLEDKYEATSSLVSLVQCVPLPDDVVASLHSEVFMPLLAFDFHEGVQAAAAEGLLATSQRRFPGLRAVDDCKTMMLHALKIYSGEFATAVLDTVAGLMEAKIVTTMELPQLVPWMEKLGKKIFEELKSEERHASNDGVDEAEDQDHNEFGEHEDAVYAMGRLVRIVGPTLRSSLAGVAEFACRATQFPSCRHAGLSLLAELIKHGGVSGLPCESAMRKALERAIKRSDDEDIQQVACYGLGLAALASPSRLDWITPLMSQVCNFITGDSILSDNAVACLARIMEACAFEAAFVDSCWPFFAKGFPVVNDLDEVPVCYRTLLHLLKAKPERSQSLSPAALTDPLTKIRSAAVLHELAPLAAFVKEYNLL